MTDDDLRKELTTICCNLQDQTIFVEESVNTLLDIIYHYKQQAVKKVLEELQKELDANYHWRSLPIYHPITSRIKQISAEYSQKEDNK